MLLQQMLLQEHCYSFLDKTTFVVAILFHCIEYCCYIFQRNAVVIFYGQAETALGQIKCFDTFADMVKNLRSSGKREKLPIQIKIDRDDPFFAADAHKIIKSICAELGIDHVNAAFYKVGHDFMDASVGVHINKLRRIVCLYNAAEFAVTRGKIFSPAPCAYGKPGLHAEVIGKYNHFAHFGKVCGNLIDIVFENFVDQCADGFAFLSKIHHRILKSAKIKQAQIHKSVRQPSITVFRNFKGINIFFALQGMPRNDGLCTVNFVFPYAAPFVKMLSFSVSRGKFTADLRNIELPPAQKLRMIVQNALKFISIAEPCRRENSDSNGNLLGRFHADCLNKFGHMVLLPLCCLLYVFIIYDLAWERKPFRRIYFVI